MPLLDWQIALRKHLIPWLGTPYGFGLSTPGVGVDCRLFVVSVYDALYGVTDPVDAAITDPLVLMSKTAATAAYAAMVARYPCTLATTLAMSEIEPGDAVIFHKQGDPSWFKHVAIAGLKPGELWHSSPGVGVCRTSYGATKILLKQIYRMDDKVADWIP
jgi:hypothetical protein